MILNTILNFTGNQLRECSNIGASRVNGGEIVTTREKSILNLLKFVEVSVCDT